jgi:hypothetical protein
MASSLPKKGKSLASSRRLSVHKIKEVLRLRFEVGLGLRAIPRSCWIGLGTAHEYLQPAEAAGVTWPLKNDWDEDRLEAVLFGGPPLGRAVALPMPDFAELHKQRQCHPDLTQQLLWEEYRQANPDGYRYSRFCELYQRWRCKQDAVLRQKHKAGEKLLVDWAGDTISVFMIVAAGQYSRRFCSSQLLEPVRTPTPRPPRTSSWQVGSAHTCGRLSSFKARLSS